ncbi:hypothetical protein KC354_g5207 [Hortaea werneckii]|nr:hypothetical protein KC354_g5207 [Hortaea werneckii]
MLATLLSFGLDPEYFDSSLFIVWPGSCDPGWLAEDLAPDPMFIDFLRVCLQRQPGFAGCDDLTEAVLTGADSEFESALRRAKGEAGVLRTCPNALGQTATHLAITSPRRLERLLQAGADPDCVDRGGLTPLMYAAAYGKEQSVLHLVRHQATWHLQEGLYGRIFLDYAVSRRNLHVVESLVDWLREAGDHDTASEVLDHCIATSIVQHNDHYDTAIPHRLFELGADADTVVGSRTLLHYANTPMMSQLIMKFKFKSFLIRDDSGKSPFMHVAHLVDAKTLATLALLKEFANIDEQDMDGQTPLHHLIQVMADLHPQSSEESSEGSYTDYDIISSLAVLCSMYEQRSIAKNKSGVAHRRRKSQLQVDYAQDEITFCLDYESRSPIRKVTTAYYKDWLIWCDSNFVKLDISGGRRKYTEYGWHLVSMFEEKVDELRSGTETWYTAPEQPGEVL